MLRTRDSIEVGSAAIESVFAIVFVMFLALASIEVAFVLYARNVVVSSAHEGARAAVELGRDPADAELIARRTVERAAGGIVEDMAVGVEVNSHAGDDLIIVRVHARLKPFGPVPIPVTVQASASSLREKVNE